MTGTLGTLLLSAIFLLASHFGLSHRPLRARLVAALGDRGFLAAYSLVAFAAFAWFLMAYAAAPTLVLWGGAVWQWFVPLSVLPVALVLLVGGYSMANPTAIGQERVLSREQPVRGVLRITRNPIMWAAGLWALAHMVPNGDAASLILFGTLAILALVGTERIDAKAARRAPQAWARFADATSNLPFAAILAGRQSLGLAIRETGWIRLGVAVLLYAVLLHAHRWLFGVSPLPPL